MQHDQNKLILKLALEQIEHISQIARCSSNLQRNILKIGGPIIICESKHTRGRFGKYTPPILAMPPGQLFVLSGTVLKSAIKPDRNGTFILFIYLKIYIAT